VKQLQYFPKGKDALLSDICTWEKWLQNVYYRVWQKVPIKVIWRVQVNYIWTFGPSLLMGVGYPFPIG
jgi:hypothetical protein